MDLHMSALIGFGLIGAFYLLRAIGAVLAHPPKSPGSTRDQAHGSPPAQMDHARKQHNQKKAEEVLDIFFKDRLVISTVPHNWVPSAQSTSTGSHTLILNRVPIFLYGIREQQLGLLFDVTNVENALCYETDAHVIDGLSTVTPISLSELQQKMRAKVTSQQMYNEVCGKAGPVIGVAVIVGSKRGLYPDLSTEAMMSARRLQPLLLHQEVPIFQFDQDTGQLRVI
jgi:hypothetical protein